MNKKKILVVEDELTSQQLIQFHLNNTGEYEVKILADGKQTLAAANAYSPDLILLDIIIPDTSGVDISRELASQANLKDIPVVFITGLVTEDEVASQDGIFYNRPCLAKPITKDKLLDCVRKNIR
ncbi:MAG: response regulator [Deltaproteobacteria bacterium]|nr:response regulator [Deltaproteobacteria bacterium]